MSDEIRKDPEIDHQEESMKLSGEQLDEVSGGAARRPAGAVPIPYPIIGSTSTSDQRTLDRQTLSAPDDQLLTRE